MTRINVVKSGVTPNTEKLLTSQIQEIINSMSSGDELYFPKGKYVLSTLFLKDDITINVAKGATLLGSLDFNDYAPLEEINFPKYQDVSHSHFNCAFFVGRNINNVIIKGKGKIDLRSVWDEKNKNDMVHRGMKAISFIGCNNIVIQDLTIHNATDLAILFTGCKNVYIGGLKLKVYIDGISPDNSKHVLIENCRVNSGDDGIVFKSSYSMNKLDVCEDIEVRNCVIQSRCNAIKFGTESNGGFKNIKIHHIKIKNTRISGIAIESVDGAIVDNIHLDHIDMKNVNAPLFIHLGARLRGPEGTKIGEISNVKITNLTAKGPYIPYKTIPWNYFSFKSNDVIQYPWSNEYIHTKQELEAKKKSNWQYSCNICGYNGKVIRNITLENIYIEREGGVKQYNKLVPKTYDDYPEVYCYGVTLPSKGIFFRDIEGLKLKNVIIKTKRKDVRPDFVFDNVK